MEAWKCEHKLPQITNFGRHLAVDTWFFPHREPEPQSSAALATVMPTCLVRNKRNLIIFNGFNRNNLIGLLFLYKIFPIDMRSYNKIFLMEWSLHQSNSTNA